MFEVLINGYKTKEYEKFKFPGGEVHVKIKDIESNEVIRAINDVFIGANLQTSDDIMELLLLTNALKNVYSPSTMSLTLGYTPYGRQDRIGVDGEPLSLKVFADLINLQGYDEVLIYDPHSDVTPALINNSQVVPNYEIARGALPKENVILVSPDAGANKKVFTFAKELGYNTVVRADKIRDVATGNITDTIVYTDHVGDKDFLIVDDICDGGRTFIELAKKLKEKTNGKIYLYVTHGIFSKGIEPFDGLIDHIYVGLPFDKELKHPLLTFIV